MLTLDLRKNLIIMKKILISFLSGNKIWLLVPFIFAFQADAPLSQYTIPIFAYSVSSADIDLDGDFDILVGHRTAWQQTNPTITILSNTGGLLTISDTSKSYCGYQENIFACKIDTDNYPDLVTFYSDFSTGTANRFLRIWYNHNGFFNEFQDFSLNSSATFDGITHGDINGDSLTDILVWSENNHFWGVLYNLGNGTLSPPEYHNVTGYYPSNIACGDLNGDGRDDVVVSGQSTEVYYSLSTGFQVEVLETNSFKNMDAIVDFDGDGDNDLLTAVGIPMVNITSLIMYRNQNDTNLQVMPEIYFQTPSTSFSVNDFNNDNLPDIAFLTMFPDTSGTGMTDTIGGIKILYNQGNFQLSNPQFISLVNYHESGRNFSSADLDGNGYNDFAIIRGSGIPMKNLELLFNDGNGNFVGMPVGFDIRLEKQETTALKCYPNPFRELITFDFELKNSAMVELCVYNLQGRFIQCLYNQKKERGHHLISWCGINPSAIEPATGSMIAFLKVNGKIFNSIKFIKY